MSTSHVDDVVSVIIVFAKNDDAASFPFVFLLPMRNNSPIQAFLMLGLSSFRKFIPGAVNGEHVCQQDGFELRS